MRRSRAVVRSVVAVVATLTLAGEAAAHAGGLSGTFKPVAVPSWLVVTTGGGVIGASFLLTSLVTDHAFIRDVTDWRAELPTRATIRTVAVGSCRWLGVGVLAAIVAVGWIGPRVAAANLAIVAVWAGWWAGYSMTTYLVGNTWPAVNPWRTLAALGSRLRGNQPIRSYPDRLGAWPSVVGLVGLVWLEVVSPLAQQPRTLVIVIVIYSIVTVAGAVVYGSETWFGVVDPIARVFQWYGRVAPLQRTSNGIDAVLPGGALSDGRPTGADETAFVVALLWVTTYDGLVATPAWATAVRAVVGWGVPPFAVYLGTAIAGFGCFLYVYRVAARWSRRTADTYVTARYLRDWFAPALVPIAAGYHLSHFLGYFLSLSPALIAVATQPLAPPAAIQTLVLPAWFGTLQLVFVLAGHMLAVWVAHARSFAIFPGRLAPIRSQYPFVLVMVFYTVLSMWIVGQPYTPPPYL
ncbi:hypothetical protein [Halococcus saccharolyticus]|uniref:Uncharacterized protein n=1 Tax=Halococcus saccharolyticus DSM 5350 TaxID=1227455 RepID=M0MFM3_9EURY|nr:hypothetical protein [Halococcus saccharolyticus]EMA43235.1 hypothetical protein C449_14692 [Halococcus saccharolyticus DSM 5350]